jgi:3-hydroxyisobutyrate dehydrogenase-like beta-hydroxyacid dehydrogenase
MKIALIGTGLMGFPMAERLLDTGHQLIVFNRTRDKALPLARQGAEIAAEPLAAITQAELTLLMLSDAAAIRETLEPHGRLPDLTGACLIQMGTIAPRESVALWEDIRRAGGCYLEAPVLGSRPQARDGKLLIMVGAAEDEFRRWYDVLDQLGSEPVRVGRVGQAAALKLAYNQLIAAELAGFATTVAMARHHRIDSEQLMALLRRSAIYAPTFDAKLPRFLAADFSRPNFPARHLLKDLVLARRVAEESGLATPALSGLCDLLEAAVAAGRGDDDYSVIAALIDPERS